MLCFTAVQHGPDRCLVSLVSISELSCRVDAPNLIADAGLMPLVQLAERCALPDLGGTASVGGIAPRQPHRRQHRPGRVLPVGLVPAILEDEERFCAMCGCFGERDGFSEAFERERLALGDAQHFISDETANLGQRAQRIGR